MKKSAKREKKPAAPENEKNLSGKGFSQKNENFLSRKGFSQKTRIFFSVKDFLIFMSCSKIRSSDFHRSISVSYRIN